MDKRVFTAFILSIAIALLYQVFVMRPYYEKHKLQTFKTQPQAESTAQTETKAIQDTVRTEEPAQKSPSITAESQVPAVDGKEPSMEELKWNPVDGEEEFVLENQKISVVFSNSGACIKELTLKDRAPQKYAFISPIDPDIQPMLIGFAGKKIESGIFTARKLSDSQILFARDAGMFTEEKIVTLKPGKFEIDVQYSVTAKEKTFFENGIEFSLGLINKSPFEDKREYIESAVFLDVEKGKLFSQRIDAKKIKNIEGETVWGALKNKYYAFIVKPSSKFAMLNLKPYIGKGNVIAYLQSKPISIEPGEKYSVNFTVYTGPQTLSNLVPYKSDFEKAMYFSGILGPVNLILIKSLNGLYAVFKNYGLAIIIITILIKILFYPLTHKSFKSMKQMQALQPKIAVLRDQYKDNQQKLQQEMMALYKREKVNPMGGCLPMLIQLPIFFSLYRVLSSAYELVGANFLWMDSLSQPDKIYTIFWGGTSIPINILPLIMGVTMFWQQKMSTADPQQQKMMMFMPVIFTFMLYNLPSGLVLYWTLSNVLSIIQQQYVNKTKPEPATA